MSAAPVTGARLSLWRAAAVFRAVALVVCVALIVHWLPIYERPGVAVGVGAAMIVWTAALAWLAVRGRAHRMPLVVADLVVTVVLTLLSGPAQTGAQQHGGMVTLTTIWAAGPTLEAAFLAGPVGGTVAAVVQFAASAVVADTWQGRTLYSGVLLLVLGVVVGLVSRLIVRAEVELHAAASTRAALAERERLARSIHDGVLQVLGLVHRAAADEGGRWAALGAAAAEQEALLRGLITSQPVVTGGSRDLAAELRGLRAAQVSVATPAEPVTVPAPVADQVRDAVRAALQNVAAHGGDGAQAWVLLESVDDEVRVTVRDDGTGFDADRLDRAKADGRIGVAARSSGGSPSWAAAARSRRRPERAPRSRWPCRWADHDDGSRDDRRRPPDLAGRTRARPRRGRVRDRGRRRRR